MPTLQEYDDYRIFLKDFYVARRKERSFFSVRYFAGRIEMDPGYLMKVMQEKIHLGPKHLVRVMHACGLGEDDQLYFKKLVQYNKAKREEQIAELWQQLQSLKQIHQQRLGLPERQFYRKWQHSVVRSLIDLAGFDGNWKDFAKMTEPRLSVPELRDSVALLEKIRMIHRQPSGGYTLSAPNVTASEDVSPQSIRNLQQQFLDLAGDCLNRTPPEERDFSGITLTLSKKSLELAKHRISEFRAELMKMVEENEGDEAVFQLGIQLFPMSRFVDKHE